MNKKTAPPDGGWGWMIVLAYALNNVVIIPIMQGFGLLFKDTFVDLKLSATNAAVIINVNSAFGMALGLINGPLLRQFGYRKISVIGSLFYGVGIILTSFATSFVHFIIVYGIMASLGMSLVVSSFSLALNSYFKEKRGRAMGLAMTITGIGPIVMPQLISFLISIYDVQGTVLILGAISLHCLVGASLLQPVKWHLKVVEDSYDIESAENCADGNQTEEEGKSIRDSFCESENFEKRRRRPTISSIDHDVETASIYGFDTPMPRQLSESVSRLYDGNAGNHRENRSGSTYSIVDDHLRSGTPRPRLGQNYRWWSSGRSIDTIHLGSSLQIFDESTAYKPLPQKSMNGYSKSKYIEDRKAMMSSFSEKEDSERLEKKKLGKDSDDDNNGSKPDKGKSSCWRTMKNIVLFFDLDLLRDPIYVSLMMGMSIAIFAEINFSILTPFILSDMSFNTEQIAIAMSAIAGVDLVFRGIAPFIGEWLKLSARMMYMISLFLLICSRTSLIFVNNFVSVLIVAIGLGVAKGIRSVYMSLVIPAHVPIERLASASGIQMVVNGFILLIAGPLLGVIRDKTGSYSLCITFINCVTGVTIVLWLTEIFIVSRVKKRKTLNQQNDKMVNED
ncbi:uncharacterized protein LOC105699394 [Orussus abietinus]|uniref:uncharacterized protein LOC105699394 n=1 Tax=Orussus abietinus TaxID=222816 RepID=UPI0006260E90|nr:uncharacterized protein LOC105699394 [Orussus abietinus]